MKILLVHNIYMGAPGEKAGGENTAVQSFATEMRARGHEVREYLRDSAETRSYGLRDKALFFARTIYSRRTVRELIALAREFRPDVAHVQNVFPLISPSAYAALRRAGVPVVQMVQNYRFLCPNGLFRTHGRNCELCAGGRTWHAVRLKCYRDSRALSALYAVVLAAHRRAGTFARIDRFIVLNEFTRERFVRHGLADAGRIRRGGNFMTLQGNDRDAGPRGRNVVYVGRLSSEKGVDVLVDAMAHAPDVRADIMGSGPEAEALGRRIAERGLGNVRMLGFVPQEEMVHRLSTAAASVVPSVCYEGLPYAVLQSMAYGTPVIASDTGGLPEALRQGACGWLFPAGDAPALGGRIREAVSDPERSAAKGAAARDTFRRAYHRDVVYDDLMKVYGEVVRRAAPPPG